MSQQDHEDEFPRIPLSDLKLGKSISYDHDDDDRYDAVARYDTAVGVVLAFAMAIGVWLYAVKPWQKPELHAVANANQVAVPLARENSAPLATVSPTSPHQQALAANSTVDDQFAVPVAAVVTTAALSPAITPTVLPSTVSAVVPTVTIQPTMLPAPEIVSPSPSPVPEITLVPTLIEPSPSAVPIVTPEPTATPSPVVESLPAVSEVAEPETASADAIPVNPTVVVRESIEFEMGSATLPESAKAHLLEVAGTLKTDARQLKIVGHTDSIGFTGANRRLSLRRALAVQRFLLANGVPVGHLSVAGAGESRPIDSNDTPEGRHHNRRIEIIE